MTSRGMSGGGGRTHHVAHVVHDVSYMCATFACTWAYVHVMVHVMFRVHTCACVHIMCEDARAFLRVRYTTPHVCAMYHVSATHMLRHASYVCHTHDVIVRSGVSVIDRCCLCRFVARLCLLAVLAERERGARSLRCYESDPNILSGMMCGAA